MNNDVKVLTSVLLDLLTDLEEASEPAIAIKAGQAHVLAGTIYDKLNLEEL